MIAPRPSMLMRIVQDLIAKSRRTGEVCRVGLAGGAQLAVLARDGVVTATIKRKSVPVGANELATFRRHGMVPADAEVLTPPEQGTRLVDGETWYYVTLRWKELPHGA